MDATQADDADIFVTLVEAAEEIDSSPDELRRAIKGNELRAVRENPANKRSRWLVALADVKKLFGEEPGEPSASQPDEQAIDHEDPSTDFPEEPQPVSEAPPTPDLTDEEHDAEVLQIVHTPDNGDPEQRPRSESISSPSDAVSTPVLSRGEELVERFTLAIDRLTDNLPQAPFDYQALLDKYVAAVERAAQSDVESATLKRKMDDLNDQLAVALDRLDNAHAENRRLLVELEAANAEVSSMLEKGIDQEDRPLWKRRNR